MHAHLVWCVARLLLGGLPAQGGPCIVMGPLRAVSLSDCRVSVEGSGLFHRQAMQDPHGRGMAATVGQAFTGALLPHTHQPWQRCSSGRAWVCVLVCSVCCPAKSADNWQPTFTTPSSPVFQTNKPRHSNTTCLLAPTLPPPLISRLLQTRLTRTAPTAASGCLLTRLKTC